MAVAADWAGPPENHGVSDSLVRKRHSWTPRRVAKSHLVMHCPYPFAAEAEPRIINSFCWVLFPISRNMGFDDRPQYDTLVVLATDPCSVRCASKIRIAYDVQIQRNYGVVASAFQCMGASNKL